MDSLEFYKKVGENIKKYRSIKNYSLEILGEKVNLTKKTVQRYETGETRIDMDRLAQIADALEIKASLLLEGTENFLGINYLSGKMINLPIIDRVSYGNGTLIYEKIEGYEPTSESWLNGEEYFYLRAKGDSMINSRIFDGDLILIRRQDDIESGQIGVVLINNETYLKKLHKHGDILKLESTNPLYPVIECNTKEQNCRIIGLLKKIIVNY